MIDETLHGFERTPSIWRQLFASPLVLVLLHAALVVGVLLWAGMGRFGAPAPAPPPLEPGQRFLIRSTAALLRHSGQTQAVLARALDNAVQETRTALRAPPGMTGAELDAWLDRAAETRGSPHRLPPLRRAVASLSNRAARGGRALALAHQIHDWKQEIVHGPPGRT